MTDVQPRTANLLHVVNFSGGGATQESLLEKPKETSR